MSSHFIRRCEYCGAKFSDETDKCPSCGSRAWIEAEICDSDSDFEEVRFAMSPAMLVGIGLFVLALCSLFVIGVSMAGKNSDSEKHVTYEISTRNQRVSGSDDNSKSDEKNAEAVDNSASSAENTNSTSNSTTSNVSGNTAIAADNASSATPDVQSPAGAGISEGVAIGSDAAGAPSSAAQSSTAQSISVAHVSTYPRSVGGNSTELPDYPNGYYIFTDDLYYNYDGRWFNHPRNTDLLDGWKYTYIIPAALGNLGMDYFVAEPYQPWLADTYGAGDILLTGYFAQ